MPLSGLFLLLLLVYLMGLRNRVELLKFKLGLGVLLLILAREIDVAFSSPVLVAYGYELYEFVL